MNEEETLRTIERRRSLRDLGSLYSTQVMDAPEVTKFAMILCKDKEEFSQFMEMLEIDAEEVVKAIRPELSLSERIRIDELTK